MWPLVQWSQREWRCSIFPLAYHQAATEVARALVQSTAVALDYADNDDDADGQQQQLLATVVEGTLQPWLLLSLRVARECIKHASGLLLERRELERHKRPSESRMTNVSEDKDVRAVDKAQSGEQHCFRIVCLKAHATALSAVDASGDDADRFISIGGFPPVPMGEADAAAADTAPLPVARRGTTATMESDVIGEWMTSIMSEVRPSTSARALVESSAHRR